MIAVLFLGIIPAGHLPAALVALSDILPSTYAVHLLLRLLTGQAGLLGWLLDGGMLVLFSLVLFLAVERLSRSVA
jgi:ABC-type multidrug transport system permease subunit